MEGWDLAFHDGQVGFAPPSYLVPKGSQLEAASSVMGLTFSVNARAASIQVFRSMKCVQQTVNAELNGQRFALTE